MIKFTSTCAFIKPVSVDTFKTFSLYMDPFQPSLLRKTRSKISLWSSEMRVCFAIVLPHKEQLNNYLAESLPDGKLWNLLLAGKCELFHKAISLAALDNASNQQHQTAQMTQMTQMIISLGYYPHSQLRNTGCYPMRKCDMGVE